jgi:hypothetical protein
MSTVQDLLNFLQFRLDNQEDLYHAINLASRWIAKRLYILESELAVSVLSIPIAASVTSTASYVFNASPTNTITDAANGFITAGYLAGMPITTTQPSNLGPLWVKTVAAGTLTIDSSTPVVGATTSAQTITSDASFGWLPADFWGLKDKPYLLPSNRQVLVPLPSVEMALLYSSAGLPLYYQIRGTHFSVWSPTASTYTIAGDYFAKPVDVTTTTDTIPYNGFFDDAYCEMVNWFYRKDKERPTIQSMQEFLYESVDAVALKRDAKGPVGMPPGIDWDYLTGRR